MAEKGFRNPSIGGSTPPVLRQSRGPTLDSSLKSITFRLDNLFHMEYTEDMKVTDFTTIEECDLYLEKLNAEKTTLTQATEQARQMMVLGKTIPSIRSHAQSIVAILINEQNSLLKNYEAGLFQRRCIEDYLRMKANGEIVSYPNIDAGSGGDWIKKPWIKNP